MLAVHTTAMVSYLYAFYGSIWIIFHRLRMTLKILMTGMCIFLLGNITLLVVIFPTKYGVTLIRLPVKMRRIFGKLAGSNLIYS